MFHVKHTLCTLLALTLMLPLPAFGVEAAPAKAYEQAVAELRGKSCYSDETVYETDLCSVFSYSISGTSHGTWGNLDLVYKAGSPLGEGTVVSLPLHEKGDWRVTLAPDAVELNEDGNSLRYTYHSPELGTDVYSVDLATAEVTASHIPPTYEEIFAANTWGSNVERQLEAPHCTVVLMWTDLPGVPEPEHVRDYVLALISKESVEPEQQSRLPILPSTVAVKGEYAYWYPTDRAPDEMFLNEDGSVLTYVYSFEDALFNAEGELLHDSGTYTYTVDTATGELAVEHTPLPSSPADPVFSDVPAGSWFEPAVEICTREGIMLGTSADTFSPDGILTDAECLTLGWRLYDQARGGDGSVPKAPENWGAITLKTDNGLVDVSGYLGEDQWCRFRYYDWDEDANYYHLSLHLGMSWEFVEIYAPCGTRQEPTGATLIFEGVEHRGLVYLDRRGVASGRPPDCSLVFLTEDEELNQALLDSMAFTVTPGQWWRDLSWAIQQESGGSGHWDYDRFPINASGAESYRAGFAQVLAAITDLPKRYDVPQIPEFARNEDKEYAYRLYEAGILGGVDEYGTFQEYTSLTRAEAATMVARVLDESLRLTQAPRPMPQEGVDYTLTYLMEGKGDGWREHSYPLYHVMEVDEEGWSHSLGMLTLDGRLIPWPEGWEGEFQYFPNQGETLSITLRDVTRSDRQYMRGIMDRNGNWLVEPGRYLWVSPLAQGGFYGQGPWDESLGTYAWYDILDGDGHLIDRVERFEAVEELLGTGEDTWENWGGLTPPNGGYPNCHYYSWPDGTPATNWLDRGGRIGPDGKGFVEKDGKIYRIEFQQ